MGKEKITISIMFTYIIVFFGCNQDSEHNSYPLSDAEIALHTEMSERIISLYDVLSLYTPIKDRGIKFNKKYTLQIDGNNIDDFKQKELLLGMLSVDFIYRYDLSGKNDVEYLQIKQLIKLMKMQKYFSFESPNLKSGDSIGYEFPYNSDSISMLAHNQFYEFLNKSSSKDKYHQAVTFLFGLWIENAYIQFGIGEYGHYNLVFDYETAKRMYDVKQYCQNKEIYDYIVKLHELYSYVQVIPPPYDPALEELKKTAIILDDRPTEYRISDENLNTIKETITEIRQSLVSEIIINK